MSPTDFPTFGTEHMIYMGVCLAIWLALPFIGKNYLSPSQRIGVALFLAVFTIFQEFLFDFYQIYINDFSFGDDLSLHMCGLGLFISAYALWKKNQTAFELAYFWGLAGAFQSIITPDPGRFPYGDISIFWNFLSHGLIILNVLWLIWVEGMRCRKGSLLNVLLVTNGIIFMMGYINTIIGNGANYWFLCNKPGGDSPFLIGEWPYYLIVIQLAGILIMGLIYMPMWFVVHRSEKAEMSSLISV
ncbi:MAG: TIGR02206 family membrane protein [Candidatus Marinimicrobia bacterium]|nr:TIGR02206 family membrane protein [Candidatus Neomarinimicrobiota bacterium]MBL7010393.1 TIGR02206 family membrane protein [Candidatus Neomarinimicrobiota bacterium]MBL7030846.1 TIGR02206 family membrane protein [Candidatus Neomarinimicrobiota bacterium]